MIGTVIRPGLTFSVEEEGQTMSKLTLSFITWKIKIMLLMVTMKTELLKLKPTHHDRLTIQVL